MMFDVGNTQIPMLIDSGATVNIVNEHVYRKMKNVKLEQCNKKVYAYGSKMPIDMCGKFNDTIKVNASGESVKAEFIVVKGHNICLLSRKTAMDLHVLQIGPNINFVNADTECKPSANPVSDDDKLFRGLGKLRDFQLKIHIDESVSPVVQPLKRLPFAIRNKVDKKLNDLLENDAIEPAEGPSRWVSQVVVIPKADDDIRMCVDMRCANRAVVRERHPIPTFEEVAQEMNGAKVFSKLDLNMGYHQIELEPKSREITTFVTHR